MISAALYLSRRTVANSLRFRLRRLRQPRYAAAFGAGILYIWWFFFRPTSPRAALSVMSPGIREGVAVILATIVLLANWTLSTSETPFPFTLAETQFLFAAPLTRRQVLLFKILRSQIALGTSAVISVILFTRSGWTGASFLHAIGLWLAYATLSLNSAGMGLLRLSLAQHGIAGVRRRIGTLVVIATAAGVAWWVVRAAVPGIEAGFAGGVLSGLGALTDALHTSWGGVLSWPLRAVVDPLLAGTPGALLEALPAGLLVFGLHVWWVVGSSIAFEEAATESAARTARRIVALRQGRGWTEPRTSRSRPLKSAHLGAGRSVALTIAWKNRLGIRREFTPRTAVVVGIATAALVVSLRGAHVTTTDLIGGFLMIGAGMVTLLGPLALRFDLRRDLEMLEVLKTYPVRGRTVVLGEVAAMLLTLSGVAWSMTAAAFLVTLPNPSLPSLADRIAILASMLAGIPAVISVFLLVQNASVLLFPAWVTVGPQRAVGLEATGQRLLMTLGSLLALILALIPAAGFGAAAVWIVGMLGVDGLWGMAVGVLVAAATVGVECGLAMQLLGGVFDRMDPSSAGIQDPR